MRRDHVPTSTVNHRRDILRAALAATSAAALAPLLTACRQRTDESPPVTLYTSVDAGVLTPLLASITQRAALRALLVTDTEATKTTGLVQRVLAERAAPAADLWWSSEILGTLTLARAGLLEPLTSPEVTLVYGNLPPGLRDTKNRWFPIALRPRVLVFNTAVATAAPRTLAQLAAEPVSDNPKPIAIANPAFGTTKGHLAALWAMQGRDATSAWLDSIRWRMVDSNSAVVRAVAQGECDLGLTDEDDVYAGQAQGWPVDRHFIPFSLDPATPNNAPVLMIPGTVALIANGPLSRAATSNTPSPRAQAAAALPARLMETILTSGTELALATSPWRSRPVLATPGDAAAQPDPRLMALAIAAVDWDRAHDVAAEAITAADPILRRA